MRSLLVGLFGENLLQLGETGQAILPGVVGLALDQGHGISSELGLDAGAVLGDPLHGELVLGVGGGGEGLFNNFFMKLS